MQTTPADFYDRTRTARKIVVVDLGFLGDSVHLVPALWEIKRHYPEAALHTLSADVGAELLQMAPCVDRAWAFPLTPKSPAWWRHWGVLGALRNEHFDVAFNFSGADRTVFTTALLGARWTLAHEGRKHFWNRWLATDWLERRVADIPVFEQRRQVLAAAGFKLEKPRFDLRVPDEARQWAQNAASGRPIHLSISASAPVKEWPLENWIALAELLARRDPGTSLVATAGANPREQGRLKDLAAAAKRLPLKTFEGLNLAGLAGLLQRCRLHIGPDSGALHLAWALGVPTLGLFRQYGDMSAWTPAGKEHRHLAAPSLSAITPEQVCDKACE